MSTRDQSDEAIRQRVLILRILKQEEESGEVGIQLPAILRALDRAGLSTASSGDDGYWRAVLEYMQEDELIEGIVAPDPDEPEISRWDGRPYFKATPIGLRYLSGNRTDLDGLE